MMKTYRDEPLLQYALPNYLGGYNSYSQGKSTCKDNEFPYGQNVVLDDNGSATKRNGSTKYSSEIASGHAIFGMGYLYNSSYNVPICASNTSWYDILTSVALTGMSFTADKKTHFMQCLDRLYGANNTDNLAYTEDGATITEVTANGNIGDWPIYFNSRLYMTNALYKDRVYYSNPITVTESSYAVGNFGTFDTDLSATPKKNAGFIILIPGGGVEITRLYKDNTSGSDYIYVYTKRHGIWRIAPVSAANADGSIAHTIVQVVTAGGTPSGDSIVKKANDQWYYGGDNWYSYGEQATYQNLRIATTSARIRTEANTVSTSGKPNVCGILFKDKIYYAYQAGSYNDTIVVHDVRLNAWGSPFTGINANCFMVYEDSSGVQRLLAGSSKSSDSYIYELESGTNDASIAINAYFETKSTDCGKTNLIKRFAFIDVMYTLLYGTLTYEVFIDESIAVTGSISIGNPTSLTVGIGSMGIGDHEIGLDYNPNTTFAYLARNSFFRIDCGFQAGRKISVRITNNNTNEQFKIDGNVITFISGDVYET